MIQIKYANLYIEKYDGQNLLVDFVQESEFIYFRNNGDYLPSMRLGEYEPTQLFFRDVSGLKLQDGDVILFPMETLRKIRREKTQNINEIQEEINETTKWINEEDKIVINSINETIVTIKEIRERKADKEIKKSPKRKERIEEENQIENNQLEEMWSEYKLKRK